MLEYQSTGAQILVCGDFNARTAKEPEILRTVGLQPFLPTAPDDELPDYIPPRHNLDPVSWPQTWSPDSVRGDWRKLSPPGGTKAPCRRKAKAATLLKPYSRNKCETSFAGGPFAVTVNDTLHRCRQMTLQQR